MATIWRHAWGPSKPASAGWSRRPPPRRRPSGAPGRMLPMRIDLYLPGFAPHDAISNHTLQTRRVLREAGYGGTSGASTTTGTSDEKPGRTQETGPRRG